MFIKKRFEGKRVLVTGATSGIGLAGALNLQAEGAELILIGRNSQRLEMLREKIPSATVISNDSSSPSTGSDLVSAFEGKVEIDGLWMNAGYAGVAKITDVDANFFDSMVNANVRGPILQMASLAPFLRRGASVLVTSSTATYEGAETTGVYAATKAALLAVTGTWAKELGKRGIRVNTLVPGAIGTNFRSFMDEETRNNFEEGVVSRVPLGRVGTPDEVAAVALFLLSSESAYVSSSQYLVDGGLSNR